MASASLRSMGASLLLMAILGIAGADASASTQEDLFNPANLEQALRRFVKAPHPMGSVEQKKLTLEIKNDLSKHAWEVKVQSFKAKIPNLHAERFGGTDKKASLTQEITGENIIAVSKGSARCMVVIGGHYDTKNYKEFRFVGANDGGSSTAAMQELARVVTQIRKQEASVKTTASATTEQGRFLDCSIALVFFDGEEATLPQWDDAEQAIGLQDNIYGSRAFATSLEKKFEGVTLQGLPIKAALVIDMIGHKNQNLFITNGSHPQLAQKLLSQRTVTKIALTDQTITDDHVPLAQMGIPLLHIIDWTNLSEWHTPKDTLEIVSSNKIAEFGDMLVRFLKQKR